MTSPHGGNLHELARRTGREPDDILDFSASINPLGPPEGLRAVLARAIDGLVHYPDPDCTELVAAIAERHGIPAEQIVVGNGSSEILRAVARACDADRAVIPVPAYSDYAAAAEAAGLPVSFVHLDERDFAVDWPAISYSSRSARGSQGSAIVFLGQPNNPTGRLFDNDALLAAAEQQPQTTFVVDEAFADFAEGYRSLMGQCPPNVVIVRSLTKFYAVPGLRLGFAVAQGEIAERLRRQIVPWSVGVLAQAAGEWLLADDDYRRQTLELIGRERHWLAERLRAISHSPASSRQFGENSTAVAERPNREEEPVLRGTSTGSSSLFTVYPSAANYLLVRIDMESGATGVSPVLGATGVSPVSDLGTGPSLDAWTLSERLLDPGIAIRTFDRSQHLDQRFFRIAVRTREENKRLCDAIETVVNSLRFGPGATGISPVPDVGQVATGPRARQIGNLPHGTGKMPVAPNACRRRTDYCPAIMIQGTSSNAGKSVLTAALCRIMLQDGIRVAPFKSQNMSLNSFVTRDGGEMGRAQVVQAQACRLEPDVRMNPVLLKPNSDTGCQVIVRGRPVGNMRVGEYVAYKPEAFAVAKACYDSLAAEHDAIVLEGAGSPGEVNLKSHDIVNMRMARHAGSPVLVVGDIDRGGVFAAFVGTMEVLAPWERKLVAGWIVNRFRGDASLLGPALDYTLLHTGRPVLGVVPNLPSLGLPQEDSVEFKSGALDCRGDSAEPGVEIAVIDLPHISNFTDFDALRGESDVRLRIIRSAAELDGPDAVLIPGSKNTLGDLDYLRRSGLADRIERLARQGREIVGICGGFQILGREICDPLGIESAAGGASGLGLLGVDTVLAAEKTLTRTTALHADSGLEVVGYEIHHGQTSIGAAEPMLTRPDGQAVGAAGHDGHVWGTYLHGVFDADGFRRWFIDRLRTRRGMAPVGRVTAQYDIESALDRLADAVRQSIPMDKIYRLMRLQ